MVGATLQPHRPEQSTLKSGRAGGLDIRVGSPILRLDVNRKQARMERPNDFQSSAARSLRALGSGLRHAERLLLRIPILLGVALSLAQTPPCGIAVVRSEGPKVDERFIPAPPGQVKTAVLKALPALGMKVHKDNGFQIEAKTDSGLLQSAEEKNKDAGVHGAMHGIALGSMKIDIQEVTQEGVTGSRLRVEFDKPAILGRAYNHGNDAVPLAEETACLVNILSTNDPVANPRGLPLPNSGPARAVSLPEATPLKIQLRDLLDSKNIHKKGEGQTVQGQTVQFEVVETWWSTVQSSCVVEPSQTVQFEVVETWWSTVQSSCVVEPWLPATSPTLRRPRHMAGTRKLILRSTQSPPLMARTFPSLPLARRPGEVGTTRPGRLCRVSGLSSVCLRRARM